jgi:ferredoxin-NADP reductase
MDETFICGPEEMLFTVKGFLENLGVDEKKIHFELFTTRITSRLSLNNYPMKEILVQKLISPSSWMEEVLILTWHLTVKAFWKLL